MNNEDKNIQILAGLLDSLDNKSSIDEFVKSFEVVVQYAKETRDLTEQELEKLENIVLNDLNIVKKTTKTDFISLKSDITQKITKFLTDKSDKLENKINSKLDLKLNEVDARIDNIKDGKDADEEMIVDKVLSQVPQIDLKPLEDEKDVVNVADFAKKVKAELLPLKRNEPSRGTMRYENISLPDELRGKVKNYSENIYESPIKTSAGNVHFQPQLGSTATKGNPNYFGHTRIEDMADNKTRRVIEVQSDLYQKMSPNERVELDFRRENKLQGELTKAQQAEIAKRTGKLQQYNDPTAHFRMVREEIKKAAQDGKTKLQFPTGETSMKIEGLGDTTLWAYADDTNRRVMPDEMKVGMSIVENRPNGIGDNWIITDVLGDGKFKAVPKDFAEKIKEFDQASRMRIERGIDTPEASARLREQLAPREETFDISGKVDTNNPIYKFYEKEMQKYLTKFGGKRIVDDKGVSWVEVPIKKEYARLPVEAFGIVGIGVGLGATRLGERKR